MRWPMQRWSQYRRVNAGAQLMDEVMERLGVDPVAAIRNTRGADFTQARSNCIDCMHARQCRRWLDASIILRAPPIFCANNRFFLTFRPDRQAGSRTDA